MLERRFEARKLCADMVEVSWGENNRCTALLEDISRRGACLQLEKEIGEGTIVRIRYPKGELKGMVRYCVFREIGYFAGVEFEPGSPWCEREFEPQHLLDLEKLAKKGIQ